MPRERIEVAAELLNVDPAVGDGLGAVDEHQRPHFLGLLGDLTYRIDRPQRVRDMGDGDHASAIRKKLREIVEDQTALLVHLDVPKASACTAGHQLPRNDVGVMLQRAQEDLVALTERVQPPTAGHEVDRSVVPRVHTNSAESTAPMNFASFTRASSKAMVARRLSSWMPRCTLACRARNTPKGRPARSGVSARWRRLSK